MGSFNISTKKTPFKSVRMLSEPGLWYKVDHIFLNINLIQYSCQLIWSTPTIVSVFQFSCSQPTNHISVFSRLNWFTMKCPQVSERPEAPTSDSVSEAQAVNGNSFPIGYKRYYLCLLSYIGDNQRMPGISVQGTKKYVYVARTPDISTK